MIARPIDLYGPSAESAQAWNRIHKAFRERGEPVPGRAFDAMTKALQYCSAANLRKDIAWVTHEWNALLEKDRELLVLGRRVCEEENLLAGLDAYVKALGDAAVIAIRRFGSLELFFRECRYGSDGGECEAKNTSGGVPPRAEGRAVATKSVESSAIGYHDVDPVVFQKRLCVFSADLRSRSVPFEACAITTHFDQYLWEQIDIEPISRTPSEDLFRGYLMIEPEDLFDALHVLTETAIPGRNVQWFGFKFLVNCSLAAHHNSQLGQFRGVPREIALVVIYCESDDEVKRVLARLAAHPTWANFEKHRIGACGGHAENAPRRPGTNAFRDASGQEWRTLCYNDVPGYSEDEAANRHWRALKCGTRTELFPIAT
jgi:hypothetical protein